MLFCVTAYTKPHCQGFNNYDDMMTIVFTGDNAKNGYSVTDVKFIPTWTMESKLSIMIIRHLIRV